jgi:hypothetical protein
MAAAAAMCCGSLAAAREGEDALMEPLRTLTLDSAAHLIQVALTPVFLLSGIAALLNVFASRLARVADRVEALEGAMPAGGCTPSIDDEITRLHRCSLVMDWAVVLAAIGAAATCLAILTLFLQAVSNKAIAGILLFFFGGAIVCTLGSVVAFGIEMLLSSRALRLRMHFHVPLLAGHFWRRRDMT